MTTLNFHITKGGNRVKATPTPVEPHEEMYRGTGITHIAIDEAVELDHETVKTILEHAPRVERDDDTASE